MSQSHHEGSQGHHQHGEHAHCHAGPSGPGEPGGRYDKVPEDYSGTVYTCPMHPQVRDVRASSCPICGMALEPEGAPVGEEDTSELDDMTRRFWISAVLTLPLAVYAMGDMIPGLAIHGMIAPGWGAWLQLLLASPVVLWGGWPFIVRGVQSVRTMNLNMFTLIGLGVSVAVWSPSSRPASSPTPSVPREVGWVSISRPPPSL